jgi:methyl-accepting chemotaxis protein
MKINFSLSLKLTLIVFSVSALIIVSLTYINIQGQTSFFEEAYSGKATALAQALDASIGSREQLEDKQQLQNYILKFIYLNPEVSKISINLPDEQEKLKVFASSDSDSVGNPSSSNNYLSYEEDVVVNIPNHSGDSHTLTVITPLHLSGQVVGTYETLISMDNAYGALNLHINNLVIISVVSLFILVISFLYLLRRTIVKPITTFRNAVKMIGDGKLDTEINIKSRDELGELAIAFNRMTNDLKKSTTEIRDNNEELQRDIIGRKKAEEELRKKVDELERYKNVTVDRELRLIELKKEVKELRKKYGEKP